MITASIVDSESRDITKGAVQQYDIKQIIATEATEVIIAQSHGNQQDDNDEVCLKFLKPCVNALYDIKSDEDVLHFQKLGYEFNRIAAKSVYYGIARVIKKSQSSITLDTPIEDPQNSQLNPHNEYTTIMKRLPDDSRLDRQFEIKGLQEVGGGEFLAREIIRIYKDLASQETDLQEPSPYPNADAYVQALHTKLELNIKLFQQATDLGRSRQSVDLPDNYVSDILTQTLSHYGSNFAGRYSAGFVRRCHGDLKANNLWLHQATEDNSLTLLALDCVDFRPTFYFIDTLSDIAMLAADIHAHTMHAFSQKHILQPSFINRQMLAQQANKDVETFLRAYTRDAQDETFEKVKLLLEYFITEKAMVCAFMWAIYDKHPLNIRRPTVGNYYFDVALFHADKLQKILQESLSVEM